MLSNDIEGDHILCGFIRLYRHTAEIQHVRRLKNSLCGERVFRLKLDFLHVPAVVLFIFCGNGDLTKRLIDSKFVRRYLRLGTVFPCDRLAANDKSFVGRGVRLMRIRSRIHRHRRDIVCGVETEGQLSFCGTGSTFDTLAASGIIDIIGGSDGGNAIIGCTTDDFCQVADF